MLTQRCKIKRLVESDSGGTTVRTPAVITSRAPVSVQENISGGRSTMNGEGQVVEYDALGFFRRSQDVRPNATHEDQDEIELVWPRDQAGRRYTVVGHADECGHGPFRVAKLKRLHPA